ncbi:hypothetical protein BN1723_007030 [Verticillium longisporum]|uniref:DUF6923 domain-containing protein n=1 Tax=Verticillium longisporum TaxID=100787 RepID=A0A0G4NJ33_VERLO|nr:hypothetical protein BN1723_007030 [Verticillium longisporum]
MPGTASNSPVNTSQGSVAVTTSTASTEVTHFYHFDVHFYHIIHHQYINIESGHFKFVHYNYSYHFVKHIEQRRHVEHIEHLEHVKHGEHLDIHDFNLHGFDYIDHVDNQHLNHLNYPSYSGYSNYSDHCSYSDHVYFHIGSFNYCDYSDHYNHSNPSDDSDYSEYSDGSYNSHHFDHFHHFHYSYHFNYSDYHIHSNYSDYSNHCNYSNHSNHSDHYDHYDNFNVHYLKHSDYHHNLDQLDQLDQLDLDHLHYSNGTSSGVTLSSVDITTGQQTLIRSNIAGNSEVNALGYNARDDYLYAVAQNGLLTSISIIRLNARGDVSVVVPQVANKLALLGGFNAGDVDENSQYWISTSGNDWYQYDLRPGSATYAQQVAYGTLPLLSRPAQVIADWAYVPGGGNFLWAIGTAAGGRTVLMQFSSATYAQQVAYGTLPLLSRPAQVIADWAYVPGGGNFLWAIGTAAGGRTVLMQFSRSTKRWTQVRDFGNIVGGTLLNQPVWGAVYASANGFLYGTENLTGQVWRFPVLSSTAPATSLVTGSPATLNDGARCLEASNLPT